MMMKKMIFAAAGLLLATDFAAAADLPAAPVYTKAPPPAVAAVYDWTGLYVGGHLGWGWTDETSTFVGSNVSAAALTVPPGFQVSGTHNGFLGGGQLGANWEYHNIVFGLEGDFSGTNSSISITTPGTLIAGSTNTQNATDHWYATATGRLGYAWNNWLLYAKGGAAWLNINYNGSITVGAKTNLFPGLTDTRDGWTAGVGVEESFAPNWSWKLEYDHMDFGTKQYTFVDTTGLVSNTLNIRTTVDVVKAGINYKFYDWNSGAAVARY
jgi:outer membrane immunogenic protein